MDTSEPTRFRSHTPDQPVSLEGDFTVPTPSKGADSFGYVNGHAIRGVEEEEDDVQEFTRCNACWGRCMPRCMCQWWYDMWPCCRPIGTRIPREDPMNPKTNLRLLFFTLLGIVVGLIGGFIVRTPPFSSYSCLPLARLLPYRRPIFAVFACIAPKRGSKEISLRLDFSPALSPLRLFHSSFSSLKPSLTPLFPPFSSLSRYRQVSYTCLSALRILWPSQAIYCCVH